MSKPAILRDFVHAVAAAIETAADQLLSGTEATETIYYPQFVQIMVTSEGPLVFSISLYYDSTGNVTHTAGLARLTGYPTISEIVTAVRAKIKKPA